MFTYIGPPKREELEEEDDEEGFGLPAVIDTGMFNVQVWGKYLMNASKILLCILLGWSCWR